MNLTFSEMLSSFTFARPAMLLALSVLPLTLIWLRAQRRRGNRTVITFTGAELLERLAPRPNRRRISTFLAMVALAVAITGFAGPKIDTLQSNRIANVMLVMDTSFSMSADDVSPTRLKVAQDAAVRFVEELPSSWRAGLVSFNEIATLSTAPTEDRNQVIAAIKSLRADRGTATGEAIDLAVDAGRAGRSERISDAFRLRDQLADPSKTIIVLLSDGKETGGLVTLDAATQRARRLGITVHTIAMGTDAGTVAIADAAGQPQVIAVPPDRIAMQAVAQTTGGSYYEAYQLDDLRDVYQDVTGELESEVVDTDVSAVFGALALLLAGLAALSALRRPQAAR
jgi:Ca-activated chloride channel family protein